MFVRSIAASACILSLFACASSAPEEAVGSGDQAASSVEPSVCGAGYFTANDLYKQAVAAAKQHKASMCEGDDAYLVSIASLAQRANVTCSSFSTTIKTSSEAAPIRDELQGSLILPFLTGDLQVRDSSGNTVFKGLDAALPGVTLWGPAAGAYGNNSKVEFSANGHVKVSHTEMDENATEPTWIGIDGTYAIGRVSGDAITISITLDGSTTEYELKASSPSEEIPDFDLRPTGDDQPGFTAYPSECEA